MSLDIQWHELAGLIGVVLILLSYFGLQAGKMRPHGIVYQSMNLSGASLLLLSLLFDFNLSAFVMESCWVVITLYGIIRGRRLRRQTVD